MDISGLYDDLPPPDKAGSTDSGGTVSFITMSFQSLWLRWLFIPRAASAKAFRYIFVGEYHTILAISKETIFCC
jgi:uncharacterized protein YqcC (DUF446 family)